MTTTTKTFAEIADIFAEMLYEDYKTLGDAYDLKFYEGKPFGEWHRRLAKMYGLTVADVMEYFLH